MRTAILIGLYYVGDAIYRLSGVTDGADVPGMDFYILVMIVVMLADIIGFVVNLSKKKKK